MEVLVVRTPHTEIPWYIHQKRRLLVHGSLISPQFFGLTRKGKFSIAIFCLKNEITKNWTRICRISQMFKCWIFLPLEMKIIRRSNSKRTVIEPMTSQQFQLSYTEWYWQLPNNASKQPRSNLFVIMSKGYVIGLEQLQVQN